MLHLQKILVPVDLSAASLVPVRFAGALAQRLAAFVTLVHCSAASEDIRAKLQSLGCRELGSQPFSILLLPGEPAREIVAYAHSAHFGLIVMATHGYGPFRRLVLGSVTTQVLDRADCPVFTGAHLEQAAAGHGTRFETVVCPVDLGPKTTEVAGWAGDFANALGARLFLLHVIPDLPAAEGDYYRAGANLALVEQATERLHALRAALGLSARVIVAGGALPDAVCHQASELGADVLVAGRGTSAGRLGRLRSSAFAIIRGAPCPVITV